MGAERATDCDCRSGGETWLVGSQPQKLDGSGKPVPIVAPEDIDIDLAGWMPDGETLVAFGGPPVQTKMEIMRIQPGKPRDVIHVEPGAIFSARVSPDGRWLAFDSTATGVYARSTCLPCLDLPGGFR